MTKLLINSTIQFIFCEEEFKIMKKLLALLLSATLMLALAGCGAEQTATYVSTTTEEGITITDAQTIQAKGDKIQRLTETTTMDFSTLDTEIQAQLVAYYDESFDAAKADAPTGVAISYSEQNGVYTATFDIDLVAGDLQELIEKKYIMITSDNASTIKYVSYSQTCAALEASGYTLQQ